VVKASDARPSAKVICYSCEACGFEVYQTIGGKEFNPINECESLKCKKNNVKGKIFI
jgi:DNA replication licensing factor MCM7